MVGSVERRRRSARFRGAHIHAWPDIITRVKKSAAVRDWGWDYSETRISPCPTPGSPADQKELAAPFLVIVVLFVCSIYSVHCLDSSQGQEDV